MHSIPLYVQIVAQEKREREKILNDHVCPTKWRLHRVSVSAFSRFSPDGPSIFILPMNLSRNLSLFIYPLPSLYPGDDDPHLPFLLRDTFSLRLRETFRESANDWDCLVFYTVKRTGRGASLDAFLGDKGSGWYFLPEGKRRPPDNYEDRYHLCNNAGIIKTFFIYFFFLPFCPLLFVLLNSSFRASNIFSLNASTVQGSPPVIGHLTC